MRFQHVRFHHLDSVPRFQLYLGHGFWDLTIWRNRWRWFW